MSGITIEQTRNTAVLHTNHDTQQAGYITKPTAAAIPIYKNKNGFVTFASMFVTY